jgi:hypothetical protein
MLGRDERIRNWLGAALKVKASPLRGAGDEPHRAAPAAGQVAQEGLQPLYHARGNTERGTTKPMRAAGIARQKAEAAEWGDVALQFQPNIAAIARDLAASMYQ